MHEALREALANCLINPEYFSYRGIVITLNVKELTFTNPRYIRTGITQMLRGRVSDPRNRGLMKMSNLIDIGERDGSRIPMIFNMWTENSMKQPIFEEEFDLDRKKLILSLEKQLTKTSDKILKYYN